MTRSLSITLNALLKEHSRFLAYTARFDRYRFERLRRELASDLEANYRHRFLHCSKYDTPEFQAKLQRDLDEGETELKNRLNEEIKRQTILDIEESRIRAFIDDKLAGKRFQYFIEWDVDKIIIRILISQCSCVKGTITLENMERVATLAEYLHQRPDRAAADMPGFEYVKKRGKLWF